MADRRWKTRLRLALSAGILLGGAFHAVAVTNDPWTIDFRYAPPGWQTAICLPDDWQKTLVGKDGSLLYDYPGSYSGFGTRITFGLSARRSLAQTGIGVTTRADRAHLPAQR